MLIYKWLTNDIQAYNEGAPERGHLKHPMKTHGQADAVPDPQVPKGLGDACARPHPAGVHLSRSLSLYLSLSLYIYIYNTL